MNQNVNLNRTILRCLNYSDEYARKVLPFIKPEYFPENAEKIVFNEISEFINDYGNIPTYEALVIQLNKKSISEDDYLKSIEILNESYSNKDDKIDIDFLIKNTEEFCQERAIYNAVLESISILDDKHKTLSKGAIPTLLAEALGVSFDNSVGHDYLDDSESRYDYYHKTEDRVPFNLAYMNKITNGGLPKKTLNLIISPPHNGKSLMMCDFAANFMISGKNVLYITCEMAEEEISKRIDANLLNITMDEILTIDKTTFDKRIAKVRSKTIGKLKVKEYPTATANVNHFRILLNELRLKKSFVPDVIFIDYLNICTSSRVKMSSSVNSYMYVMSIGQELRGLAQEFNVPLCSATQTNKLGANNTDIDMTNVSESFGLNGIADFMIALMTTDELTELGQVLIKQLKNRYRNMDLDKRFVLGVDKKYMRLFDIEQSGQEGIIDKGNSEDQMEELYAKTFSKKKSAFEGFTV